MKLLNPFEYYATHGFPLDMTLTMLEDKGIVPDWPAFWDRSIEESWNPDSTFTKIVTACRDVYGKEHAAEVEYRLKLYIINLGEFDETDDQSD